jgi:hypothetical protein
VCGDIHYVHRATLKTNRNMDTIWTNSECIDLASEIEANYKCLATNSRCISESGDSTKLVPPVLNNGGGLREGGKGR